MEIVSREAATESSLGRQPQELDEKINIEPRRGDRIESWT